MPERQPFPDIPRYPKQEAIPAEDLAEEPAEPPLEGAPHNALESVILQTPELAKMLDGFHDYKTAPNTKKARGMAEQLSHRILRNPNYLPQDLDALELIREAKGYKGIDEFSKAIDESLERAQFPEFPPKAKTLEQWLTMSVESAVYGPRAEAMMKRMVDRCKDTASISKFSYELSLAGLKSSNPHVVRKTLEILFGQSTILPTESEQMRNLVLASFDPDDEILKRTLEIDGSSTFLAHNLDPEILVARDKRNDFIAESPEFTKGMQQLLAKDPVRMDRLIEFYDRPITPEGIAAISPSQARRMNESPFTLILQNPGPLRV